MVSSYLYDSQGKGYSEKVVYRYPRNQGLHHDEPEQQAAIYWIFFTIISKGLQHFHCHQRLSPPHIVQKKNHDHQDHQLESR